MKTKMNKAEMIKEIQGYIEVSKDKDHLSAYWLADKIDLIISKILRENEDEWCVRKSKNLVKGRNRI